MHAIRRAEIAQLSADVPHALCESSPGTPEQFIREYAERIYSLWMIQSCEKRWVAAREYIVEHHDWKRVEVSLLEIYEDFFQGTA